MTGSSIKTPRSLAYRLPTLAWVRACALRGEAGLRAAAACAVAAAPARPRTRTPAGAAGPLPAARLDTPGADTGQPRTVTAQSDSHTRDALTSHHRIAVSCAPATPRLSKRTVQYDVIVKAHRVLPPMARSKYAAHARLYLRSRRTCARVARSSLASMHHGSLSVSWLLARTSSELIVSSS